MNFASRIDKVPPYLFVGISRKIAENTEVRQRIGRPVSAFDDDDKLMNYALRRSDAAFVSLSRNDG